jgi:hypothetical protein
MSVNGSWQWADVLCRSSTCRCSQMAAVRNRQILQPDKRLLPRAEVQQRLA